MKGILFASILKMAAYFPFTFSRLTFDKGARSDSRREEMAKNSESLSGSLKNQMIGVSRLVHCSHVNIFAAPR